MNLDIEMVRERIKQAKEEYGLSYSQVAREIGVEPVTIHTFIGRTNKLSKARQLQALCVIKNYENQIKQQLGEELNIRSYAENEHIG